jgi:hypothetical protein
VIFCSAVLLICAFGNKPLGFCYAVPACRQEFETAQKVLAALRWGNRATILVSAILLTFPERQWFYPQ